MKSGICDECGVRHLDLWAFKNKHLCRACHRKAEAQLDVDWMFYESFLKDLTVRIFKSKGLDLIDEYLRILYDKLYEGIEQIMDTRIDCRIQAVCAA